jgi:hypothetical protein
MWGGHAVSDFRRMLAEDWTQDIPPKSEDCDHRTMSHATVADRRIARCLKCHGRWWRPAKLEKRNEPSHEPAGGELMIKERSYWWLYLLGFLFALVVASAVGLVACWAIKHTGGDRTIAGSVGVVISYLTYWRVHERVF